jgi:uncharacterized delta-60 repeat protein
VAGSSGIGFGGDGTANFALLRYNTNGSLDSTFGTGGIVETDNGGVDNYLFSVALQADGKIVAGGGTDGAGGQVLRYTTGGVLDLTFDGDGLAGTQGYAQAVAVQGDGKIVAAGSVTVSGNDDLFVSRLLDTGAADVTFGVGGTTTTPIGTGNDRAFDLALQSDGKIVLAGTTYYAGAQSDALVARYLGDSPLLAATPGPGAPSGATITNAMIAPIVAAAQARWQSMGVDPVRFSGLRVSTANLAGNYLGLASGTSITLDRDAAGWGWYVDPAPRDDFEFKLAGNQGEQNRMDLLTAVMHEMGHVLGLDHDEHGVMAETLTAGVRRTRFEHHVGSRADQVFRQGDEHRADAWLGAWLSEQFDSISGPRKRRR